MRIVLAPDLHLTAGLNAEMTDAKTLVPPRFYAHVRPEGAFWHNRMMLDEVDRLTTRLARLCKESHADLCIFLGDLTNLDTPANLVALHRALRGWPCEMRWVLGNHDIYIGRGRAGVAGAAGRAADPAGFRWEELDGFGLLCLDNFVRHEDGTFDHAYRPGEIGHTVTYRDADIRKAVTVLDGKPRLRSLVLTHMPLAPSPVSLAAPGRKLAASDPALAALRERIETRRNILAVCGHGHYNTRSRVGSGMQWALPSIIEYPCAAALCEVDSRGFRGRLMALDEEIAGRSLAGEAWPAGDPAEQSLDWSW
jgi:hypothetical protein